MTFLPLIERELRLRARSPSAYWTRFVVALAGVVICLPQLLSSAPLGSPASVGRGVFHALVCAAFLLICGVCLLTAGALNTEQREGTLGLLLLTRVRVLDVLLGKLGSIGLTSLCVLVAFLPMLMLPVLAGGVTGGEALRKGLGLLNILLFSLAAGLYGAASRQERFKAARFALLLVALVTLVPFLLALILGHGGVSTTPPVLTRVSPLVLLISAGDVGYRTAASPYWTSMAALGALSCLLLAGACVRLARALRGEGDAGATPEQALSGRADSTVPPRRGHWVAGQASPVAWRAARQRGLKATVWAAALLGFFYYGLFGFIVRVGGPNIVASVSWALGLASSAIVGSLFAWAASRFLVESRRTGEFELLLTTPEGARTIISDQWEVLKRLIRWPLVLMVAPVVLQFLFVVLSRNVITDSWGWRVHYAISNGFGALNTVFGLLALCWLAIWFGLRAGTQARVILWSVAVAKGVPYVVALLFNISLSLFFTSRAGSSRALSYWMMSYLPQCVDLLFFLFVIRLLRGRLLGNATPLVSTPLNLRQAVSSAARDTASAFRKARHWTPS